MTRVVVVGGGTGMAAGMAAALVAGGVQVIAGPPLERRILSGGCFAASALERVRPLSVEAAEPNEVRSNDIRQLRRDMLARERSTRKTLQTGRK